MKARSRTLVCVVVGAVGLLGLPLVASPAAVASQPVPNHTRLVPSTPRADVPRITNGRVLDIETIGNRVFLAGTFTSIANVGGAAINQRYLASYNIDTKKVDANFKPTFDGDVMAVEASPDGSALYVVGAFNTVGGATKRKIVKLNPTTGAPIAAFTANGNSKATAIDVSNTAVYVGGQFTTVNSVSRTGLVALNPTTGAVDTGFNLPLSGGIGVGGLLNVQQLKLTHNDSKLLVVHTGRQIAGQDRYGVGLIDTATKTLLPWRTRLWDDNLAFVGGIQRVAAADIAPNDSYFVVTSGSGGDRPPISDTAMAFPVAGNDNVQPIWVSRHFDSVYSVAITETAVYVGGHFSWQESPTANQPWPGLDNVGYGTGQGLSGYNLGDQVVRRDHIGALDPATGTALEWNPGSNSVIGEEAMKATPRGLFVGGDGNSKGGASIGRVAFFDFTSEPAASPVNTTITAPIEGAVKTSNTPFTFTGTAVAPAGITKVQLEIQNRDTHLYLQPNLTSWGPAAVIKTTVNVNATSSPWSLTVSMPTGSYQVQAKTFGKNNTSDPTKAVKKIETFSFDDIPPNTAITSPAAGSLASTTFLATGTASDDKGVSGMSFWFRDANNQYLQDDGTVASSYNTFGALPDTVGATSTIWQYQVALPHEGVWRMSASAIDSSGQADLRGDVRDWAVSATGVPPSVTVTAPVAMNPPTPAAPVAVTPGTALTISGTATDDTSLKSVNVYMLNNSTHESLASDGTWGVDAIPGLHRVSPVNLGVPSYNWSYTTPALSPGIYTFAVLAIDNLDLLTPLTNAAILTLIVQVPGDAFPNGLLSFTGIEQNIDALHLDLTGTATDATGVQSVKVALRDLDTSRYVQPNGTMAANFATLNATLGTPGGTSTTFSLSVNLPTSGQYSVEAFAVDTAGQQDSSTAGATARYLVYPGDADPGLEPVGNPTAGQVYTDSRIVVSGRAIDDLGMGRVEVRVVNSANQGMSSSGTFSTPSVPGNYPWIAAFLTSPGSPGSNFAYTTPVIPTGTYTVQVRAVDSHGQVQQTPRIVTVTVGP